MDQYAHPGGPIMLGELIWRSRNMTFIFTIVNNFIFIQPPLIQIFFFIVHRERIAFPKPSFRTIFTRVPSLTIHRPR